MMNSFPIVKDNIKQSLTPIAPAPTLNLAPKHVQVLPKPINKSNSSLSINKHKSISTINPNTNSTTTAAPGATSHSNIKLIKKSIPIDSKKSTTSLLTTNLNELNKLQNSSKNPTSNSISSSNIHSQIQSKDIKSELEIATQENQKLKNIISRLKNEIDSLQKMKLLQEYSKTNLNPITSTSSSPISGNPMNMDFHPTPTPSIASSVLSTPEIQSVDPKKMFSSTITSPLSPPTMTPPSSASLANNSSGNSNNTTTTTANATATRTKRQYRKKSKEEKAKNVKAKSRANSNSASSKKADTPSPILLNNLNIDPMNELPSIEDIYNNPKKIKITRSLSNFEIPSIVDLDRSNSVINMNSNNLDLSRTNTTISTNNDLDFNYFNEINDMNSNSCIFCIDGTNCTCKQEFEAEKQQEQLELNDANDYDNPMTNEFNDDESCLNALNAFIDNTNDPFMI